ncbi:HupE/UreJ family protein [Parvularcula lutaonensis]|uniref:HupE/UreJ family protein n=1 Tax=Parvularcula lutaonensis TaxID=491923 RepID=A0ABV7M8W4_9PROT|nr:HupE/UreJ family protein [Parvularcula lutaonensis]GGY45595.1 hypothetical protein GCM10007148_13260 [Parvularcula lutaonensis]
MWTRIILVVLVSLFPGDAWADVVRTAKIALEPSIEDEHGEERVHTYLLTADLPQQLATLDSPVWPDQCTGELRGRFVEGQGIRSVYALSCDRPLGPPDAIVLPWRLDGAEFEARLDARTVRTAVTASDGLLELPLGEVAGRSLTKLAGDFLYQGVLHIWFGWDHLLFVIVLTLMTAGGALLRLVTAFTAGHSVSLALGFFDVIRVPILPVEAVIALSIVFLAREAMSADRASQASLASFLTIGLFGVLHGLGFASALAGLGVGEGERLSGLLFFNVGVELGQIAIIAVLLGLIAIAGKTLQPARQAVLVGCGGFAMFWMIERTFLILQA